MDIFKIDLNKLLYSKDLDKSKDYINTPIEENVINMFSGAVIKPSIRYRPIGPGFFPPQQIAQTKIARSGVKHISISRDLF